MIRVSKQNPCPCCGRPDWCLIGDDSILCMRTPSSKSYQMKNGDVGYWHDIGSTIVRPRPVRHEPKAVINAPAMMAMWLRETSAEHLRLLSDDLGVKASALMELGVAWAKDYNAYAFPMKDGFDKVVGIRLRNKDGDKWAVKGSNGGLFYPRLNVQSVGEHQQMVCVEGPTSCAAALSMNLFCVGRPSNSSGLFQILDLIKHLGIKSVVLVSDNDEDKYRPDGSKFNPGLDGCESLSARLNIPHCCITLPCKDIREFYRAGNSIELFESICNEAVWRKTTTSASA